MLISGHWLHRLGVVEPGGRIVDPHETPRFARSNVEKRAHSQ